MPTRWGIYGHPTSGTRTLKPSDGHVDMHGVLLSQNTNVHPAFGMDYKVDRNRKVVRSVIGQTWGLHAVKNGYNVFGNIQEKLSDPHHRPPDYILFRARQEASIAGRMRGYLRPSHPQLVQWKNQYWVLQRTRGARGTTIGPYGTVSGKQQPQSVLARIGGFFQGTNQGVQ